MGFFGLGLLGILSIYASLVLIGLRKLRDDGCLNEKFSRVLVRELIVIVILLGIRVKCL